MIERHWKGISKPQEADAYIHHLKTEIFPGLNAIKGFISASILKRKTDNGMEFLIVTVWNSIEAIKQFAGENPEISVVPLTVQNMMITYDKTVSHYELEAKYVATEKH